MTMKYKLKWIEKHAETVAAITQNFTKWLGEYDPMMYYAAYYHDIGKNLIDPEILDKSSITQEEMELIKTHTTKGNQILQKQTKQSLVLLIALEHHENYNGSGYPNKKHSSEIFYPAQIIRITDSYAAMTETRNYQKSLSPQQALQQISKNANILYNPVLSQEFIKFSQNIPCQLPIKQP